MGLCFLTSFNACMINSYYDSRVVSEFFHCYSFYSRQVAFMVKRCFLCHLTIQGLFTVEDIFIYSM